MYFLSFVLVQKKAIKRIIRQKKPWEHKGNNSFLSLSGISYAMSVKTFYNQRVKFSTVFD